MIRAVIGWSLRNRLIVALGTVGLVGVGLHSASNLNVEAYPDPTPPLVEVISQRPGSSPEEMERLVGVPIETALNGIPGLVSLRSTSVAGLNDIKCQFTYETDFWGARQEVLNRIASVDLPEGVVPTLSPWSPTGEIVRYVLEGPGYTTNQLKAAQDWVLERALKQVPGVVDVVGFGGTIKQYQVLVDTRLMKQYGLSIREVEEAIRRSNANVGGDVLALGSQAHNVRAIGLLGGGVDPLDPSRASEADRLEARKVDDLRNVRVATSADGTPIRVHHIARVVVGHRPRLGLVGRDGEDDVIEGIVLMRRGEKSLPTSRAVAQKFEEIEREGLLPRGMKIRVFNQRTDLVHVTTHNVLQNLVVGVALVVAVLLVFLGDLAAAGVVALVIPLALLFAVSVMYALGKSANLLSIGAVDFGIIVDSSVIIVERIHRHLTEPGADAAAPIVDRIESALQGVGRPLLFSTLILVTAFLPLFTMTGPAGALFGPMAMTYAFSILGALLIATTLAPVLCSFLFRGKAHAGETLVDRLLKRAYGATLRTALDHRAATALLTLALLAGTATMVPSLGAEFMPELEEGNLWIRAILPRTTSLDEAARMAPRIRGEILEVPEVRGVMSQIGRPDDGTDVSGPYNLEFNVPLRPMEQWRPGLSRRRIQDELAARFRSFPGIEFSFSQLIRDNIDEALSGIKGANSIKLYGSDLETLEALGARVEAALRGVPGIEDVGVFHILGQPNLEILVDRDACARFGVSVEDVEEIIEVAIGGQAFSQMIEGEKRFDIVLRLPEDLRNDPVDIARIPVDLSGPGDRPGARIPLGQLATIVPHRIGASAIYRENNRRYLPIKFSVRGRDLASAIEEARLRVEDPRYGVELPPGYRVEWSGEFAQMQQANRLLMVMVPLSVALILILLQTTFGSLKDALLVMLSVFTALVGGFWALRLTETNFSISAAVGFISILGVVVQNGVLLIGDFNRLRGLDVPVREAIERAAIDLIRPVTMISLTAILGLMPAALADSVGSQAQRPLAIVVVGGMAAAMILPQYLLPVLYSYLPAPGPRRNGEI